jgi:5-methylthioadenosine/S-adenosylhomocysteine deaminase
VVVTNDSRGRVLDPGVLYIDGDTIAAVGTDADRLEQRYEAAQTLEAAGMLVLPGLVNAHYHSSDSLVRGLSPEMPLEVWSAYTEAGRLDRTLREISVSAQLGALEALATGTTTVLDHLRLSPRLAEEGLSASVQAHLDVGVRTAVAPVLSDLSLGEAVPVDAAALPEDLRAFVARPPQPAQEQMAECERFLKRWAGSGARVRTLVGPSAPQRCSDGLLEACIEMAARFGVGLHLHFLETRTQLRTCEARYGRTAAHLRALGALGPRTSLVHAVWATDHDLDEIGTAGTSVVHCPTANLRLGSGIARVREMLRRGIRVALGTDGAGCNDSLNLITVMKAAGLLSALDGPEQAARPDPASLLRMGTLNAAAVAGWPDRLGALAPGWLADVVLMRLEQPALVPLHHPVAQFIYATEGARIETVIVGGEVVLRDGRSMRVDETALYAEARELARGVVQRNAAAYRRAGELAPHLAAMVSGVR